MKSRNPFAHFAVIAAIALTQALTQALSGHAQPLPDPDQWLVADEALPSVMLLGTFHFAYYNLDAHKVAEEDQVDIRSPKLQEELRQVVDHLLQFKPNKVAIEAGRNTGYLMQRYRQYQQGTYVLGRDEREQIAFRVLEAMNLDTLYGVDDSPLVYSLYDGADSLCLRPVLDTLFADWDFSSPDDPLSARYKAFYEANDQMSRELPLLTYLMYLNSPKVLQRGFGAYLTGDFTLGETRGADALSMHWFNRNLRIFRHIQAITTSPNDRILVIYGAGHVQILDYLFSCSPAYHHVPLTAPGQRQR
ncbi:MAG: hypothetical protein GC205_07560 [Bacteroidetes bacterium]|nr:hypothetical protein [Bacteroidota bacterium]